MYRRIPAIAIILAALGCSPAVEDVQTLPMGSWRATLELPGGPLRFGLEMGREGDGYRSSLINGQERVTVPVVRYANENLLLSFPTYNNQIDAQFVDGRLVGNLRLVKREGTQTIPFAAEHGSATGTSAGVNSADVSGRWKVTFTESDDSTYPAVGEFAQRGSRLFGTFLTPTGDYRYLGGEFRGNDLTLSTFDGAHAFLFKAEMYPDGSLHGDFWSGLNSHETWIGRRDQYARLPNADALTALKPGYDRLTFAFPDTRGNVVSLDDARFDGKVVIVTLVGSWCPNCHDEAAMMAKMHQEYGDQGLEIVALMFEHVGEFEEAAKQIRLFRQKFSIEYPTLIAGSSDKDVASELLPQLDAVLAFPTTLFIDRNGAVRRIHTGFSGPGTGEHYTKLQQSFTDLIEQLLSEARSVEPPVRAESADHIDGLGAESDTGAEGANDEEDQPESSASETATSTDDGSNPDDR